MTTPNPTLARLHALAHDCPYHFPKPCDDAGLVGLGGDLTPSTLLYAYLHGIFPWFNAHEPIAWWNPNLRCVIYSQDFTPAKSLVRTAKKRTNWHITLNHAFDAVMHACSLPRSYSQDTWIHDEMKQSYGKLFELGAGFSVEIWETSEQRSLVGGLYGLKIGACVFGESMFHRQTDASKLAFWALNRLCILSGIPLIDCQLPNDYLLGLGAITLPREQFLAHLATHSDQHSAIANQAKDWTNWQFCKPLSWLYQPINDTQPN